VRERRFGRDRTLLEPDGLPVDRALRAAALVKLARSLGDESALDPVVGSTSVLVRSAGRSETPGVTPSAGTSPARHEIPVVYDGPDLDAVAERRTLRREEVVALHTSDDYTAVLTGFLPGFAYLADLPEPLRVPRLPTPRARVGALAVGVAGPYGGVYPSDSPGGWNLLGRAVTGPLFDPRAPVPPRIRLLDRVRFVSVEPQATAPSLAAEPPAADPEAACVVRITKVSGLATLQDDGRPVTRRWGVPTSGAFDREALEAARARGASAVAIELMGGAIELTVEHGSTWVCTDGELPRPLSAGDSARWETGSRWSRLLGLGGAPVVEPYFGSCSTLLGAKWAGLLGMPLTRGQRLFLEAAGTLRSERWAALETVETPVLEIQPHEDARVAPDALAQLCASARLVSSRSNRVGVRLEGPPIVSLRGGADESMPTVPGLVQLPQDGVPIVLGPDSATTGGYPVLGLLTPAALSTLARVRPGRPLRFVVG
jgi:allophanate hydrolase subunit 1/allophanate hydrolase subunit 2